MQTPPKFASFRPKPKPQPATPAAGTAAPSTSQHDPERLHRSNRHRENEFGSRRRSRSRNNEKSQQQQHVMHVDNDRSSDLFTIDRRGDNDNLRYGTNDKSKIPNYWPSSARKILGEKALRIKDNNSRTNPLSSLTREDLRILRREQEHISADDEFDPKDHARDFLPIRSRRTKRKSTILGERPAANTEKSHHSDEDASSQDEGVSDGTAIGPATKNDASQLKVEHARLAQLVKSQPEDARAWLDYIAFQESWMKHGNLESGLVLTEAEARSSADVKLSIYSKALDAVARDHPAREQLLMGMMQEAELVLEHIRMHSKWREIAESNENMTNLSIAYIKFNQSSYSSFRFDRCRDLFAHYLGTRSLNQNFLAHGFRMFLFLTRFLSDAGYNELAVALWQAMMELHCFTPRQTPDVRLSGSKKAEIGIPEDVAGEFEKFWDNEDRRLGESGALGWTQPVLNDAVPPQTRSEDIDSPVVGRMNKFVLWSVKESRGMALCTMPGRATQEVDDGNDDPYHIVFFSDLKPFLHFVSSVDPPAVLLNAFLCFNDLPPLLDHSTLQSGTFPERDSFLTPSIFENLDASFAFDSTDQLDSKGATFAKWERLMHNCVYTTDDLFLASGESQLSSPLRLENQEQRDLVINMLQVLVDRYPEWTSLAEYSTAFELSNGPAILAKRKVKALLKTRSSNLRLYNAYARIEAWIGNTAASDSVLNTAISMSTQFTASERRDVIVLWETWIWQAIETHNMSTLLERFMSLAEVDNETFPTWETMVGHIEEKILTFLTEALSVPHRLNATYAIELLALLRYVSPNAQTPSLEQALSVYQRSLLSLPEAFIAGTFTVEILHEHRTRLIRHHIRSSYSYRPRDVRDVLEQSIALFPANTMFLSIHRENERRSRIDDRVRDLTRRILHQVPALSQQAAISQGPTSTASYTAGPTSSDDITFTGGNVLNPNPADNIFTHFFAITTELQRGVLAGSTRHSIRAAFERAAASRACRNSAALWSAWVAYECSLLSSLLNAPAPTESVSAAKKNPRSVEDKEADERRKREQRWEVEVKKQRETTRLVFFRGLRYLPWVKKYAMLALGPLKEHGVLLDEDCQSVYDGMVEKGLRIITELEE